jgi:hypothetical protein
MSGSEFQGVVSLAKADHNISNTISGSFIALIAVLSFYFSQGIEYTNSKFDILNITHITTC